MYQNTLSKQNLGLSSYFSKIYNYMAGGLAVSGVMAYLATQQPLFELFYKLSDGGITFSVLGWIAVFAPLILVFMMNSAVRNLNVSKAQMIFWLFSMLMGISLSNIFLVFTASSIARVFFISAGMFLATSLFGYTTKRSLGGLGSFLYMGLIGLIIAMIVNIFVGSTAFELAISAIGVFLFVGLTAYDTQKLKQLYFGANSADVQQVAAISGALSLYLDFINLFQFLLTFLGDRRS